MYINFNKKTSLHLFCLTNVLSHKNYHIKFFIIFNSFREKDIFRNILQLNFMYIFKIDLFSNKLNGKSHSYNLCWVSTEIQFPNVSQFFYKDHQTIYLLLAWSIPVSLGSPDKDVRYSGNYILLPYNLQNYIK